MRSDEVHMHYNGAIFWPLYVLICTELASSLCHLSLRRLAQDMWPFDNTLLLLQQGARPGGEAASF